MWFRQGLSQFIIAVKVVKAIAKAKCCMTLGAKVNRSLSTADALASQLATNFVARGCVDFARVLIIPFACILLNMIITIETPLLASRFPPERALAFLDSARREKFLGMH